MGTITGEVIKGQPLNGKAELLPFVNPATGEQFGSIPMTRVIDVKNARREMATAARTWAAKPVKERVRIVCKLQALLIDELDEITAVMNQDNGKSRQDAMAKLFMSVDLINQYCNRAPHWLRRRRVSPGLQIFKRCYIEQHHYVTEPCNGYRYSITDECKLRFIRSDADKHAGTNNAKSKR